MTAFTCRPRRSRLRRLYAMITNPRTAYAVRETLVWTNVKWDGFDGDSFACCDVCVPNLHAVT